MFLFIHKDLLSAGRNSHIYRMVLTERLEKLIPWLREDRFAGLNSTEDWNLILQLSAK